MSYFLAQIKRTRPFSKKVSELVFQRPITSRYKPGDKVTLMDFEKDYYIASGVQEVWARILIDDIYIPTTSIRIKREPTNDIPSLIGAEPSKTVVICNDLGVAPALSYCATYPNDKFAGLFYKHSGEGVNIEWLKKNQKVTEWQQLAASRFVDIPTEPDFNYYICCTDRENALIKDYLLNQGVSAKVMFTSFL